MDAIEQSKLVCARDRLCNTHAVSLIRFRTAGVVPPFIPLAEASHYMPPVIFDQFYCGACLSQPVCAVHRCRKRYVTYYLHCHCLTPNSLQCRCAAKVVRNVFFAKNHCLKSDRAVTLTKVCCDYWACVPVKCLGIYSVGASDTHYFLVLASRFEEDLKDMASRYAVTTVKYRQNLIFAIVSCRCSGSPDCVKAFSRMLNCFRMITCCSFNV